jgi:hypothetical protein
MNCNKNYLLIEKTTDSDNCSDYSDNLSFTDEPQEIQISEEINLFFKNLNN